MDKDKFIERLKKSVLYERSCYEEAAARITELEAALAAEKRLVADYAKHNAELVAECERLI